MSHLLAHSEQLKNQLIGSFVDASVLFVLRDERMSSDSTASEVVNA